MNVSASAIFLLSLPRSGSTWLQRILASNGRINSTPETWLLLPLIEVLFKGRALTEYNQFASTAAQSEFFVKTGIDKAEFHHTLADVYSDLFAKAAGEEGGYFLEKTPRNHLVADEIIEFFPKSKFIFLWRDPADIALSLSRSYAGRWNTFFRYQIDFKVGIKRLVQARQTLGDQACSVNYEDLRHSAKAGLEDIYNYLGIDHGVFEENELGRQQTKGQFGDRSYLGNAYRGPISKGEKSSIIKVLNDIDPELYAFMGYEKSRSIDIVKSQPTRFIEPRDLAHPFLKWAYQNQLAASMHRWRGAGKGFPDFGVE